MASLDKETATLVAAMIAAIVTVLNTFLSTWRQARIDEKKWERSRKDDVEKWQQQRRDEADRALRSAIAELAKLLATCAQAMSWLTWNAKHTPALLEEADFLDYNTQ